ncbi:MAG: orc1/cdc6 family replication initiation protein [Candidatus Thermoplasmatota archaeon]|jgi:cell division control protein 6|nr:orc1/cdc6 family replication initiation protein [Candidatus Thermoplasmatota archaeon]MEC9124403.1 orc1/cdc6 family replication initiation protein [Candidatus Thermoplasmatota archaeon]|tara:strand:+ start:2427 stop:3665 length:1239 start_codon:yes stop_codon:yes gene_type:complete
MRENIFDSLIENDSLFVNRGAFEHGFEPQNLPHREKEIRALGENLVEALRGHIPSNMLLYGVPGSGKTIVTKTVLKQLKAKGRANGTAVKAYTINCRTVDTKYRVVQALANCLERDEDVKIPFTGWPTDRVLEEFRRRMDRRGGIHVIVLDEIDHLVSKVGDSIIYNLTNLNLELESSRCCIIGISNDLYFTKMLTPQVASRLAQIDLVFHPYGADQINDILEDRVLRGVRPGALDNGVIGLCSALAAQEHGDARRALDLLRIAIKKAQKMDHDLVDKGHVRLAQSQLEHDQLTPVLRTLPLQQKILLFSICMNEDNGLRNISTGEIFRTYSEVCHRIMVEPLTPRRISSLLNELDNLGIIIARNVSKGRGGRSKQINSAIPESLDVMTELRDSEPLIVEASKGKYRLQRPL